MIQALSKKKFEKAYDKLMDESIKFTYIEDDEQIVVKTPFYGLKTHLLEWLNACLKVYEQDPRVAKFISCVPYYLGDHSNCSHTDDEKVFFWLTGLMHEPIADKFIALIDEQANIIMNVSSHYTTHPVESLNATFGRVAPKKSNCNRIRGRIASGIIRQNAPFLIRDCCGFSPLSPSLGQSLTKDTQALIKRRLKSHEAEVMKVKNISKQIKKHFLVIRLNH